MKKWFACLAVAGLLFGAGVSVSHAESWYYVEGGDPSIRAFIDNDSVQKNSSRATLRLKLVDPDGGYSIYNAVFDRGAKYARFTEALSYDPQGNLEEAESYSDMDVAIEEGSNLDSVYHLIW